MPCAQPPRSAWVHAAARSPPNCSSDVHHGAGERPGDPGDGLDVGRDQPAEFVDVGRLGPDDHGIGAGDVLSLIDTAELADVCSPVGGLADFGLNEDVSLHHEVLPGQCGTGAPWDHATVEVQTCDTYVPLWPEASITRQDAPPPQPEQPQPEQPAPTLAGLGEFGLIRELSGLLPASPGTLVGIGDDAAVLAVSDGRVVATTDFLLEGRHFRRAWSSGADAGHKAAARSLADLAAMGADPAGLLLALAAPPDLPVTWARDLARGLAAEAARAGAAVIGGGTARADSVLLGVTGLCHPAWRDPVLRSGATAGEVVAGTGPVGHAAAGLALLTAGMRENSLVSEHLRP